MKNLRYYVTGNTADGFVNYVKSNIKEINKLVVLKHPSNKLKTAVIQKFIHLNKSNDNLEILLSPLGLDFLDGVIIRGKSLAVVDERIATPVYGEAILVDLTRFVKGHSRQRETNEKITKLMRAAYEQFATGLSVHDRLEEIYIAHMDFQRADQLADDFIRKVLSGVVKQSKQSHVYHRLFGTNTPQGAINEVRPLLNDLKRNYFVKGRAGTGKSTFMKKVLAACQNYGFDIELYHCSFDPKSIDMVLVRDLDFCIFDSTDPHEFFPEREGEEIIDMYAETVEPGTDEKYAYEIHRVTASYKTHMKQGISYLQEARAYLDLVEDHYRYDDYNIDTICTEIIQMLG